MESTTDGAGLLAAPWTIDTLVSAGDGDGGGACPVADGSGRVPERAALG